MLQGKEPCPRAPGKALEGSRSLERVLKDVIGSFLAAHEGKCLKAEDSHMCESRAVGANSPDVRA